MSIKSDSNLTLYSIDTYLTQQQQTVFENIVGKGEIGRNEQFLLSPQCFLLNQIILSPFVHIFDIMSLFAAELEEPKIGISGKGLKHLYLSFYLFCNPKIWLVVLGFNATLTAKVIS